MPAEVERMVFATDTQAPWHGLGGQLTPGAPLHQWREEAGLNWKVVRLPVLVQGKHTNKVAERWQALVRSDNGTILDIVSQQYQPIQNAEVLNLMQRFLQNMGVQMETAGSLKGGRMVWAMGKVPQGSMSIGGDAHETYILVSTGHESGHAFQAEITDIRVVCLNTLKMARNADSEARFRHNHRSVLTAEARKQAYKIVEAGLLAMHEYAKKLERWQQIEMGQEETQQFVLELLQPELLKQTVAQTQQQGSFDVREKVQEDVLGRMLAATEDRVIKPQVLDQSKFIRPVNNLLDAIVEQPGAELGTLANAFNGVTYWVDHKRGRSRDSGLAAAWWGEGARVKQRAFELAEQVELVSSAGAGERRAA